MENKKEICAKCGLTKKEQKEIEKRLFSSEYGELNWWKINLVYDKVIKRREKQNE